MPNLTQKEQKQKITIKALICRDNKILVLKESKKNFEGEWELPGGTIKFGEAPKETLRRELKEELGIKKVKIGKIIDVWSAIHEVIGLHINLWL